jgi:glycosyltransferase involved in cell wall biosynthesis
MEIKPRTLVILTPGFPSDEGDTACLPAQQIFIRALNRNYPKLRVVLISFEYPLRRDRYGWFGNTVIAVGGWKKGWMNKMRTCLTVYKMLNVLQRENDLIGLLSFWAGGCALVGEYYSRWKKLQHFIWILGQDARKGNKFMAMIRPADTELVAMSRFLADEIYRNYGITPRHIIPNGVDPSLYGPATLDRDIDVLGVGSVIPLKQYDLFVSLVHQLATSLPGIRGMICGKGPELNNLQQMIGRLGLQGNMELAGEKSHQDAIGYMQRAKILLHTSSYEGFSSVCLEALFAGAHVISFCDPTGIPVKNWHVVSDPEEMFARALALLQDPYTAYEPVQLHTMDDSAREMMGLFGYKEAAIL